MRKTIVAMVALCAATTANATILRVSNVNGSTAPYQTIQAAHDAASAGDTIMVDGSSTNYDKTNIKKKLVIIGPGFWLNENGLVQESAPCATATFTVLYDAAGTVIEGFRLYDAINYALYIAADNCVVRRCYIQSGGYEGIKFTYENGKPGPTGGSIHHNFFRNCCISGRWTSYEQMSYVQITNNIFINNGTSETDIQDFSHCYIAYNTMIGSKNGVGLASVYASTIEHNIIRLAEIAEEDKLKTHPNWKLWLSNIHTLDTNEWNDNIELFHSKNDVIFTTDKDIRDLESIKEYSSNYGAFAGDSPYVLSGIPAAPVIEDLVVPTTIEAGRKMNVTIKLGIQK